MHTVPKWAKSKTEVESWENGLLILIFLKIQKSLKGKLWWKFLDEKVVCRGKTTFILM